MRIKLFCLTSMLTLILLSGCAAGKVRVSSDQTPPFEPNYLDEIAEVRFATETITYKVVGGNGVLDIIEPRNITREAVAKWQIPLENHIDLQEVSPEKEAQIVVEFFRVGEYGNGVLGLTRLNVENGVIISSKVMVARNLTIGQQYKVAQHEFGHALGIRGHSSDQRDLMWASSNKFTLYTVMTLRDTNTIRSIYYMNPVVGKSQLLSTEVCRVEGFEESLK